jgi:NADH:ubiquinone oxidoreductase subunit C
MDPVKYLEKEVTEHASSSNEFLKKGDEIWVTLPKDRLKFVLTDLKNMGLNRITTITGLDNGRDLEVFYHFPWECCVINIRIIVDKKSHTVESITDLYPGVSLFERELSEMLGIHVKNHPDPRKLFLSEKSPKCPLRKR